VRQVKGWTVVFGWTALMVVVWTLFVPRGLSVSTFMLLCLVGPLVAGGLMLWRGQRPSPSIRQVRATLESNERAGGDARTSG